MEIIGTNFMPGDPRLIDHIIYELKAQGVFDQFRKECIADVDTKPAYQNLRQRVENNVTNFLKTQKWSADLNKNQVREMLRKDISDAGFLEPGVERIVDQVVNPKVSTVLMPQVENVVYKFLGIEKPSSNCEPTPENIVTEPLHVNVAQNDLLPNDLEAISPESETTEKKLDQSFDSEKIDDNKIDEDESPPFEPLEGNISQANQDENSVDSHLSGLISQDSNHSETKYKLDNSNQDSQFSKQSSGDGHLSIDSDKMDISEDSSQSRSKWMEVESKSDPNSNSFNFNLNDNENKFKINSVMEQPVKEENIIENNKEEEENCKEIKLDDVTEKKAEETTVEENKEPENEKSKGEDKKAEKHKSSDKHKTRHDKNKDKDRKDKERKDKNSSKESKERKNEKDKSKSDKDKIKHNSGKSEKDKNKNGKEKDNKHKIKSDDSEKSKPEKQRDKSKSEKDKSRDDKSKSKDSRDKSKDNKIKDKENDKKESKHKSDESKEKSSSSKHKSSSKDTDQKDKSSKNRTKSENGSDYKSRSESKQKKKSDSKSSEESTTKAKEISKHKKDEKRDKSKDSKRDSKRTSKDDHYGSKGKKWDRRSTDRDSSDGRSGNHSSQSSFSETPQKQKNVQETSNSGSGSGDSGNSDDTENMQDSSTYQSKNMDLEVSGDGVQVPELQVKLIKPKFASNIYEAMRLMKIRKQLHKIEKQNQLNCLNNFSKTTFLTCSDNENNKTKTKREQDEDNKNKESELSEKTEELVPPPLANQVITKESWDALEAKLAKEQNLLMTNIAEENPHEGDEKMDTDEIDNTQTSSMNEQTDSKPTNKEDDEETLKEIETKPKEIESISSNSGELSKPKKEDEIGDNTDTSHLNINCPSDTDNLTHLKTSLEKLEQDISLITSIVNKRQQKPTEVQEEAGIVKRNVLSDSNTVLVDGKNKKQQSYVEDNEVPNKPAPRRGRKRKESSEGSYDHQNNNKIENHISSTDIAPIIQVNLKVPNNTIPINSKIPAKKKKTNGGNGVVTTDVKLDLGSLDGRKPVKNGKKETEPPKTTKRKNTTERLTANLQRYSSDDLYKPRLNFNSRRRSARALGND